MSNRTYYEPILHEKISMIPDSLLPDLINFIDVFQNAANHLVNEENNENTYKENLMKFAGSWNDFEEADEFINEIYERRSSFFKERCFGTSFQGHPKQ